MYSNLTLYYLNQLGIIPWISKENHSRLLSNAQSTTHRAPKLIVLTSSIVHGKAESLLNKMIASIHLHEGELEIVRIQENSFSKQWLQEQDPTALLVLGMECPDFLSEQSVNCPVITSLSPEHLISNPSDKRKAFQDLYSIKSLFSVCN